ncbi:myosin regulatory light chain 12 [Microdochium nivale]|nr:myosin regulatory light chain 12 [Microdochium nivale]
MRLALFISHRHDQVPAAHVRALLQTDKDQPHATEYKKTKRKAPPSTMSAASGYKPSPLGYGSPARNSPFRRPESPASPSPSPAQTTTTTTTGSPFRGGNITPTTSPTKQPSGASFAHSRLGSTASVSASSPPPVSPGLDGSKTPRYGGSSFGTNTNNNNNNSTMMSSNTPSQIHLGSPAMISRTTPTAAAPPPSTSSSSSNGNALSQLQPSQVRTLRDGFQILDRNSDGVVTREDVADMLGQLGLPSSHSDLSAFFPPLRRRR